MGDTRGNAPSSKWCAYNAISEYHQHHAPVCARGALARAERRFVRATEDAHGVRARALELVLAA